MKLNPLTVGQLVEQLGEVGKRLSELGAAEGAAGNLSICVREPIDVTEYFPIITWIDLPVPAPQLAGATVILTGSGRRLREIAAAPTANLACIVVEGDGERGRMFAAPDCRFSRVTSEFNSHLAVHHDQMRSRPIRMHAVLHAQPTYITFLSHIPKYQDREYFNTHLLRWQPETILNVPDGIGVLPFLLLGSRQLMIETMLSMREHHMVVWSQHGIIARADDSIFHALDLVEYMETAAQYETLNLLAGEASSGIAPQNLRAIAKSWKIEQKVY